MLIEKTARETLMDKQYWHEYYEKHRDPFGPSLFASMSRRYMKPSENVIDLGCGNGRDSIYFAQTGIKTVGIDQCENIITHLNNKVLKMRVSEKYLPKAEFRICDMSRLKNSSLDTHVFDHTYSRFTLHSINYKQEQNLIQWIYNHTKKYFFVETRSDLDYDPRLEKESTHYRRFLNFENLLTHLINKGFRIKYAEIGRNFSPVVNDYDTDYPSSNPILIRIIASPHRDNL